MHEVCPLHQCRVSGGLAVKSGKERGMQEGVAQAVARQIE